jgi:hypothetical protein
LAWYHSATWYKLHQKWTGDDYAEIASMNDEDTIYDTRAREGTAVEIAPILDRVVRLSYLALDWFVITCVLTTG